MASPIRPGFSTITPHLVVKGAPEAIAFYKEAFGAEELGRMTMPAADGTDKVAHCELQVGGSKLFLAEEFPEYGSFGPNGPSPVTIHLYVTDADATWEKALAAGAKVTMPLADMFWGDRYGKLVDPFGHNWSVAEHLEEVSDAQIAERLNGEPVTA